MARAKKVIHIVFQKMVVAEPLQFAQVQIRQGLCQLASSMGRTAKRWKFSGRRSEVISGTTPNSAVISASVW